MTTYGSVNGAYTASQYDLLTTILRGQFGFGGIVMTDWWAAGSEENGPESIQQTGSMIRAQNDLYMVTADSGTNANGDDTAQALAEGRITRGELQRAAYNICRFLMDTPAYLRMYGWETDLDRMLAKAREEEDQDTKPKDRLHVGQTCDVPEDRISTQRGAMNVFEMTTDERGIYLLEAEVRSELGNKLAQIPMTVLLGPHVIETVSLNGGQTEWTRIKVELPLVMGDTFYLKLFFAQGGMAIRSCRITLLSDRGGSMEDFMTGRQKE
jgi:beta-glucosidase